MKIFDIQILQMIDDVNKFSDPEYIVHSGKIGYKRLDGINVKTNIGYRTMFAYLYESKRGVVSEIVL